MQRGNLDDLRALVAVGRERSFTKAAAKLGVSQSALSQTIRQLEMRLGVRLLTRTTRSVSPTEAGERLLRTVEPRFEEIDAEIAAIARAAGEAGWHHPHHGDRECDPVAAGAEAGQAVARVSGHQGRDDRRLRPDGHRCRALRRRRQERRAGREGHDRGAHRPRPAHGCRRRAVIFREAGPSRRSRRIWSAHNCINLRLPTHGSVYAWEFDKSGRELKRPCRRADSPSTPRRSRSLPRSPAGAGLCTRRHGAAVCGEGRLRRVLEDWCQPYPAITYSIQAAANPPRRSRWSSTRCVIGGEDRHVPAMLVSPIWPRA